MLIDTRCYLAYDFEFHTHAAKWNLLLWQHAFTQNAVHGRAYSFDIYNIRHYFDARELDDSRHLILLPCFCFPACPSLCFLIRRFDDFDDDTFRLMAASMHRQWPV